MGKIKISKTSGKLSGLRSINTNPLNNIYCDTARRNPGMVCSECYSRKMLATYRKVCAEPWTRNGEILSEIIPWEDLPVIRDQFFRLHSHGELLNSEHLINFYNIARKNPRTTFALWTKRDRMVSWEAGLHGHFPPENMIMIYSCPLIGRQEPIPEYFDKTFTVIREEQAGMKINCGGKSCLDCMLCYSKATPTEIIELLK